MDTEAPPTLRIHRQIALTPEEERDVENDGDEESEPEPEVLAANTLVGVPRANPTPVLYTKLVSAEGTSRLRTYRCRVVERELLVLVQADPKSNPKGDKQVDQANNDGRGDPRVKTTSPEHAHEGMNGDDLSQDSAICLTSDNRNATHQSCTRHTGLTELLKRSCIDASANRSV